MGVEGNAMRNLVWSLGVLVLVLNAGGGDTLRAAPLLDPAAPQSTSGDCPSPQPAPSWVCVSGLWFPPLNPAPPPPPPPLTPQVISVGEEVTGLFFGPTTCSVV